MAADKILRWQDAAVHDLEETHAYLVERNAEAAIHFAQSILDAADHLRTFPEMGPIARDLRPVGRYRHVICDHHRLIYRIEGEVVWLLRVWDSRRDPRKLKIHE